MTELKPCPFCGGEAKLADNEFGEPVFDNNLAQVDFMYSAPDAFWVECKDCFAMSGSYNTEEEAIEAWNRRAEDADLHLSD